MVVDTPSLLLFLPETIAQISHTIIFVCSCPRLTGPEVCSMFTITELTEAVYHEDNNSKYCRVVDNTRATGVYDLT